MECNERGLRWGGRSERPRAWRLRGRLAGENLQRESRGMAALQVLLQHVWLVKLSNAKWAACSLDRPRRLMGVLIWFSGGMWGTLMG